MLTTETGGDVIEVDRFDDVCIVLSGSGIGYDGAFLVLDDLTQDAPHIEHIDNISSHTIVVGALLCRLLVSNADETGVGELLVYDHAGISLYKRIDGLADTHGVAWNGSTLVVANTARNQVLWISLDGAVTRTWQPPGLSVDSWHINGIATRGDRVYISAFGNFATERGYSESDLRGRGMLYDIDGQRSVVTGLSCPHDPRYSDGAWLVCDSLTSQFLHIDERTGLRLRASRLDRWTRGLAVTRDRFYVGLSAQRYGNDQASGALAILDRATWTIQNIVPLPVKEVNSVAVVPRGLLGALRRGFRTNRYRTAVHDRDNMFRQIGSLHAGLGITPMGPLDAEDCRITVQIAAPTTVRNGEAFDVVLDITNHGSRTFFSAPDYPVTIGMQGQLVTDAEQCVVLDEQHDSLPEPLAPGCTLHYVMTLRAPEQHGECTLTFSLVQEALCWFHDIDAGNAASATVFVATALAGRASATRIPTPPNESRRLTSM
jgi:hypothetical protein